MRALLILAAFVAQGALTPLLSPWPPPDLLLLVALSLSARTPLWRGVLVAYLLGGAQDLSSGGMLGTHAFVLAAAVFAAGLALPRPRPGRAGSSGQLSALIVALVAAFVGKAAAWTLLLTFLGHAAPLRETLRVVPLEAALTFGVVALLYPLGSRLARRSERRLYL